VSLSFSVPSELFDMIPTRSSIGDGGAGMFHDRPSPPRPPAAPKPPVPPTPER